MRGSASVRFIRAVALIEMRQRHDRSIISPSLLLFLGNTSAFLFQEGKKNKHRDNMVLIWFSRGPRIGSKWQPIHTAKSPNQNWISTHLELSCSSLFFSFNKLHKPQLLWERERGRERRLLTCNEWERRLGRRPGFGPCRRWRRPNWPMSWAPVPAPPAGPCPRSTSPPPPSCPTLHSFRDRISNSENSVVNDCAVIYILPLERALVDPPVAGVEGEDVGGPPCLGIPRDILQLQDSLALDRVDVHQVRCSVEGHRHTIVLPCFW